MKKTGMLSDRLYRRILSYLEAEGVDANFPGGVLLALSGGADSVLLAYFLSRLSRERGFSLAALHVHHHLRGEEADRDAELCTSLCKRLSIPFRTVHVDVRAEAERSHGGIEEAARRLRYRALRTELAERELRVIATAHHATDHLETVLQHLLRGGGARALLGIRPQRGDLVRPLLCLTKQEIAEELASVGIAYATDATNDDPHYTRNYLRAEILPRLAAIVPEPETAALRMSEALSHDVALLDELAARALADADRDDRGVDAEYLRALPEALRRRVLVLLFEAAREPSAAHIALEHTHITELSLLLRSGKPAFVLAVPNRLYAHLSGGRFSFRRRSAVAAEQITVPLPEGDTLIPPDFLLTVRHEGEDIRVRCSSNFYKIDTIATISSAIINGSLYARHRAAGDAYFFRGHTHTLKKLYNELHIPKDVRPHLPILCDADGILWVPFGPVRERKRGKSE